MSILKPEMHDLGKLIDNSLIEHDFEDYPGKLKSVPDIKMNPIWEGIIHHHFPNSFQTFVLSIADGVASATSRHGGKEDDEGKAKYIGGKPIYNVHKLWNPPSINNNELSKAINKDVTNPRWVAEIVEFINRNPSVEEFFRTYGDFLKQRAEDAHPGSNITSLWIHSKLTDLLYNFLYVYLEKIDDNWFKVATKDDIRNLVKKIRETQKIKVVRIKINFSQNPVKVRDLNVFDALAEIKCNILRKYPDNVIFVGFNELLLILPLDEDFEDIKKIVLNYGFWFEFVERIQNLNQPYPDPDRIMRQIKKIHKMQQREFKKQIAKVPENKRNIAEISIRKAVFEKGTLAKEIIKLESEYQNEIRVEIYRKDAIYSYLPSNVDPPICELCQLNQATEKWEDIESGIAEELCINCLDIRKRGPKFSKLYKWEKEGFDKILWIKIDLEMDELISMLEDLYAEYLKTLGVGAPEERTEIRFSILSEFFWDYKEFLDEFKKNLSKRFGENNFQQILDEFIAINMGSLRDIQTVLEIYDKIFTVIFPKFKKTDSPIKIGAVCSNIKYPFLECWRTLSNLDDEINISLISKGKIKLPISELTSFLSISLRNKTLLHKLTALSEISYKLALITLYDRQDRDYKKYESLRSAAEMFGFQNVLTYSKIIGG